MKNSVSRPKLQKYVIFALAILVLLLILFFVFRSSFSSEKDYRKTPVEHQDPLTANYDTDSLDNSTQNLKIKYGYELFVKTAQYIGPQNGRSEKVFTGNNLACNNCHLQAGTKPFSGMLIGVTKRFPQYRGRENKIGTIKERINGCMERSMNGRKLPGDGPEMDAFVSYLKWLSRFSPKDGKIEGKGFVSVALPDRAVDLEHGEQLFSTKCITCHQKNGKGIPLPEKPGYLYPPLWGKDSYNNGAGMARVITAAQFIKGNMPFGTTYKNPQLSDEESYDLAGYINSMPRPKKTNLDRDFPDLVKKPVSTPYPPYADSFSVKQHQNGPFQPIMQFYLQKYNLKKSR